MRLVVLAVGRLKRGPERELEARYVDRCHPLGRSLGFSGPQIVEFGEGRAKDLATRRAAEAADILHEAGDDPLVALDETGAMIDSAAFAKRLRDLADSGTRRLAFAIGGADGLDGSVLRRAGETLAFGRMTLPHQFARLLLAEQIYRAMTILAGHPYHRS